MPKKQAPQNSAAPDASPNPASADLPSVYSDEVIQAKQENAAAVFEIEDEWYGQISDGDPFYDAAKPYIEANPDKHFRWLTDPHSLKRGTRGYQPVYDKNGKAVELQGARLGWIPRDEYERRRRAQEARTMSAVTTNKENYREAEKRAAKDSGGAIEILPDEGERFVGNRRVAV